jgi:2-polyprenyl-6-methoxyphenol hydroxylase-like FAD-dependent oxidoreductase
MTGPARTPVVIVGGGSAALTLALFLDRHGVRSTVVGADRAPDPRPVCGQGPRTMEHFRRLSVSGTVRSLGLPAAHPADVAWFTRYDAPESARLPLPSPVAAMSRAAEGPCDDQLPEPWHPAGERRVAAFLHEFARTRPCVTLRDGGRVVGLEQDATRVLVRVADEVSGAEEELAARYAVLADGGLDLARGLLGSVYDRPRTGGPEPEQVPAVAARLRLPTFAAEMAANGPARSYRTLGAGPGTELVCLDGAEEFALLAATAGPVPSGPAQVRALVRRAAGRDLPVEVLEQRRTSAGSALVAERFVKGRVFLLGDSAHPWTPYDGSGTDTAVDDAANLAWKLAAVLRGWGHPRLPASYASERRPAALRAFAALRALGPGPAGLGRAGHGGAAPLSSRGSATSAPASAPASAWASDPYGSAAGGDLAEALRRHARRGGGLGLPLGVRYEGSPVVADEPGSGASGDSWGTYVPSAAPGCRAPHVWLEEWHGPGTSLYDRLGPGFTLLRLGPEPPDGKPFLAAAQAAGVPLTVLDVEVEAARDLFARDLALVRPDLHIAWRGNRLPTDPDELVARVTGAGRAGAKP